MFRYVILFVSLVWASLLLLSWSDPVATSAEPRATAIDISKTAS
jgi:hypothetical protein